MKGVSMLNVPAVLAIYRFEMARFWRTACRASSRR